MKPDATPELKPFLLRLLLALPACFALWHLAAAWLFAPLAPLLELILRLFLGDLVSAVSAEGAGMLVDTRLSVAGAQGQSGFASVTIDSLIFSYNLPVLLALMLATRARDVTPWRALLAYLLLLPAWLWGMSSWLIITVAVKMGPDVAAQVAYAPWQIELSGLAYMFGYLMLPSVAALLAWAWLCPDAVRHLFRAPAGRKARA